MTLLVEECLTLLKVEAIWHIELTFVYLVPVGSCQLFISAVPLKF